jgi:hypothetical protein
MPPGRLSSWSLQSPELMAFFRRRKVYLIHFTSKSSGIKHQPLVFMQPPRSFDQDSPELFVSQGFGCRMHLSHYIYLKSDVYDIAPSSCYLQWTVPDQRDGHDERCSPEFNGLFWSFPRQNDQSHRFAVLSFCALISSWTWSSEKCYLANRCRPKHSLQMLVPWHQGQGKGEVLDGSEMSSNQLNSGERKRSGRCARTNGP